MPRSRTSARPQSGPGSRVAHPVAWLAALLALLASLPSPGWTAEPVDEFVTALKANQYHDLAIEYLKQLETSPLIPDDQRAGLGLEIAKVHVELATRQRSAKQVSEALQAAEQQLRLVLDKAGDSTQGAEASLLLATVLWQRAERIAKEARENLVEQRRDELNREAAAAYTAAQPAFHEAVERLRKQLESLPKAIEPTDRTMLEMRQRLRAQYVAAIYSEPLMIYEAAAHGDPQAADRREQFERALEEFKVVADKARKGRYQKQLMLATLHQGLCRQELGDPRRALSYFEELLSTESASPPIVSIQLQALKHSIDCWMTDELNSLDRVLAEGPVWLERAEKIDGVGDELQEVQVRLARAAQIKLSQADFTGPERDALQRNARRWAANVAKRPGPHQKAAQQLLAELGVDVSAGGDGTEATDFPAALAQGKATFETITQLVNSLAALGTAPEAAEQAAQFQTQLSELRTRAVLQFQQCLKLASPQTTAEELATAQNYLAVLYYQQEDFLSAAVIAEFVAEHHPVPDAARQAAILALAATAKLNQQTALATGAQSGGPETPSSGSSGDGAGGSAAIDPSQLWSTTWSARQQRLAEMILARWPTSDAAGDAVALLINAAATRGELAKVDQLLNRLPTNAPQRASAELQAGLILWNQYLTQLVAASKSAANPNAAGPSEADRAAAIQRIQQTLVAGLEKYRGRPAQPLTVQAVLVLTELSLQQGDAEGAAKWLNDAEFGPRTLLASSHPAVQSGAIVEAIDMAWLRIQVNLLGKSTDAAAGLTEAQQAMQQLQQRLQGSAEGQQRLTRIYVTVTRDLKHQMDRLAPEKRPPLARGLELFLDHVSQNSQDPAVQAWAADTYLELAAIGATDANGGAAATNGGAATMNDGAIDKGLKLYERLFTQLRETGGATGNQDLPYLLRRAKALTTAGRYELAMQDYVTVLTRQPMLLNIQTQAAETLEQWGQSGHADAWADAIRGYGPPSPAGQPPVWGWARIANVAARHAQYRDTFFDARWRVASCRLKQGVATHNTDLIKQAEQDIQVTRGLYPDLGGDQHRAKFTQLLGEIGQHLGRGPQELEGL
ncbi:MAG: hypothetical protein U0795_10115 [Pirellulales bacterium]